MNNEPKLDEAGKEALKTEIIKAVEDQLAIDAEMTRTDAITAVVNSIQALEEEKEMGGMGTEADQGMKIPGEEEGGGEEE